MELPSWQDIFCFTFVYSRGISHPSPAKSKRCKKKLFSWSGPPEPKRRVLEELQVFVGRYRTGCWWVWSEKRRGCTGKPEKGPHIQLNWPSALAQRFHFPVESRTPFPVQQQTLCINICFPFKRIMFSSRQLWKPNSHPGAPWRAGWSPRNHPVAESPWSTWHCRFCKHIVSSQRIIWRCLQDDI